MSNLINISTILIKRGNTAAASAYVGPLGELLVDTGLQTLRVQDGATPGGMSTLATTAQVSNVIVAIEGIQSNTANISALIANIHGANISGITSNVSILQSLIYGNVGNITLGDGNLFLTTYPDGLGNLNAWVSTTNNNTGIYISPSNTNEFAELYLPSDTSPQQGYVGGAGIGGFQVYGYNGQYTVNLVNNVNITANSAQWNFNGDGTLEFPDTTIQSTAYQGPAGQTDFATQANVVTANVALKGYVDSKIALLANAPAILDTLGQIATAIQNDEGNIGTILTNITATNANVTAANVAWQANAATQQGLIKTLQGQVYANANASAYLTTYLPTYTGNLTAGNLVVSGNINYLGAVNYITGQIGQFQGNAAGFGALYAGILSGFTYQPQTTLQVSSNFNGYAQINSQNINSGAQASSDFVATADNGTASTGYIDVGIASSTYSYPGFAPIKPNDGYVLVTGGTGTGGGNLILTTGTANDIIFAPNDAEAGRFSSTGALTTQGNVTVGGNLFVGSANIVSLITSLQSNAASQESEVTGLRANIIAANSAIQTITANIGGFYTWANANYSNYSNVNVSAYLAGNVTIGNVTSTYFIGNGNKITNVTAQYLGAVQVAGGYTSGTNTGYLTLGPNGLIQSSAYGLTLSTPSAYPGSNNITVAPGSAGNVVLQGNIVAAGNIYYGAGVVATGNITSGNVLASGFFYANGTPFVSSNYGNTQVAAYIAANPITPSSLVNGSYTFALQSQGYLTVPTSQYGTAQMFSTAGVPLYIGTLDSGNYWQFKTGGVLQFPDNSQQTTAYPGTSLLNAVNANVTAANSAISALQANIGSFYTYANATYTGGGGTTYSNANVVSMLSANTAVYIGNVGNVATYTLQANNTQMFIGNSATFTSGGYTNAGTTYLMDNIYFGANGATYTRNTQTGAYVMSMGGTNGFAFSGTTGAVTGNTYQALGSYAQLNSSGLVTYNGIGITSAGLLTSTGGLALNTSATITTNQASAAIFNSTATSIAIGGAAPTITLGTTTAGAASNVFVANAVGTNNGNLTVRAFGTFNTLTTYVGAGGYNSPPYTNQSLTGGSGTGMIANYSSTGGYPNSFVVTNPGTGYKNGDILTLPGGLGCTVILTNYNSNYTGQSLANWTFGLDGNLTLPINANLNFANGINILSTIAGTYGNTQANALLSSGVVNSISTTGNITTTANIIAPNYLFANGVNILSTVSGGTGTYSNTNVAAYIGATSFSSISTALINNVGQINGTAIYLQTNGSHNFYFDSTGNLVLPSGGAINYSNGQSILSGISAGAGTYSNTNVSAYLTANPITSIANGGSSVTIASSGGNAVVQIGGVQTATISQSQITVTGNVVATANVTAANIVTTGATSGNISGANVISANTFQVSTGIFWANGTAWSSSSGGGTIYSNTNVAAYLTTASITTTGNITAPYILGNTVGNSYGNISGTTGTFTGNVTAGNIIANQYGNSIGTTATYTGNITAANIITTGTYGNITNANVISANTYVSSGNITVGGALFVNGTGSNIIVKTGGIVAQNVVVAMDNIKVQWYNLAGGGSNNALQMASQTGTPTVLMTYFYQSGLGGSPAGGVVSVSSLSTTFANLLPTASGVGGDTYTFTGTVGTNAYRITAMTGSGYNNNILTIERLV